MLAIHLVHVIRLMVKVLIHLIVAHLCFSSSRLLQLALEHDIGWCSSFMIRHDGRRFLRQLLTVALHGGNGLIAAQGAVGRDNISTILLPYS